MNELVLGNLELFLRSAAAGLLIACVVVALCFACRRLRLNEFSSFILSALPFLLAVVAVVCFAANIPYDDDFNTIVAYAARPWPERVFHLFDYNWEHRVFLTNFCTELMLLLGGCLNFKVLMIVGLVPLAVVARFMYVRLVSTGNRGTVFAAAASLLLLSLFADDTFWPMASLQNYGVLCLGLASVWSFQRKGRLGLVFSCLFAVLATFSSGGGMLVWPCLVMMNGLVPNCRRSWVGQVVVVALAVISVALYFSTPGTPQDHSTTFSICRAIGYFLTFVGGWCCLPGVSLFVGLGMCGVFALCLFRVKNLKHPEVFFFAGYIMATMAAGAVCRSDRIINALPPRHAELSFALMGCFLILVLDEFRLRERLVIILSYAFLFFAVMLNVFSFMFWGSIWHDRLEIDRRNLLIRPIVAENLTSVHGPWHESAVRNLKILGQMGIYDSRWTLSPSEDIPTTRTDPGDFWTPGRRKVPQ